MQIEQKARTLFPTNRIIPLLTILSDSFGYSTDCFTKIRRSGTDLSRQLSEYRIEVMTSLIFMFAMPFNLMILK